uniref:Uncharacterized protein n=1 Tax=Palpitomonas bilix TaxID=652834 RepID=A0A7S3G5H5_9EUKA
MKINMQRRMRAEEMLGKSKKWEKDLQLYLLPFALWIAVQAITVIYFETTLDAALPLTLDIYDGAIRMVASTEAMLYANILISTLAASPASDFGLLFGRFNLVSDGNSMNTHSFDIDEHVKNIVQLSQDGKLDDNFTSPSSTSQSHKATTFFDTSARARLFASISSGDVRKDFYTRLENRKKMVALRRARADTFASAASHHLSEGRKGTHSRGRAESGDQDGGNQGTRGPSRSLDSSHLPSSSFSTLASSDSSSSSSKSIEYNPSGFYFDVSNATVLSAWRSSILTALEETTLLLEASFSNLYNGGRVNYSDPHHTSATGGEAAVNSIPTSRDSRQYHLLYDPAQCLLPSAYSAYCPNADEDEHHLTAGLAVLMQAYLSELKNIYLDEEGVGRTNQLRVEKVTEVYYPHVVNGLNSSLHFFVAEAEEARAGIFTAQITLFSLVEVFLVLVFVMFTRPYLRLLRMEGDRSLDLLARIPRKFGLDGIIGQVLISAEVVGVRNATKALHERDTAVREKEKMVASAEFEAGDGDDVKGPKLE